MQNIFALPERLADSNREAFRKAGLKPRYGAVTAAGFQLDVALFWNIHLEKVRKVLGPAAPLVESEASYKGQPLKLFIPSAAGSVVMHKAKDVIKGEDRLTYERAYAVYSGMLQQLAKLTGFSFNFHADRGRINAPERFEEGMIRIFTNCGPPGDYTDRYVSVVFGHTLRADGLSMDCRGPTKGRGIVLKDGDTDVVQIVGNNWYLLMPTLSNFHPVGSPEIFTGLITLAWNAYRTTYGLPKLQKKMSRQEFVATATKWVDEVREIHVERIADAEKKIADLQKSLAFYYRTKREWESIVEHFRSAPHLKEARGRVAKDYLRIMRHPDVRSVAVVEGGIHVTTKCLTLEVNGGRYEVGDFTIRLDSFGGIAVWGERPTHPEGVPHPHIAKDGIACYGNATEAITKASAYHRYGDVVELVLRWLRHGYTPELAARKIEEWRVEKPTTVGDIFAASNEDCP